jgi:hypothetical protein
LRRLARETLLPQRLARFARVQPAESVNVIEGAVRPATSILRHRSCRSGSFGASFEEQGSGKSVAAGMLSMVIVPNVEKFPDGASS